MKALFAALLLCLAIPAHAQEWLEVARGDRSSWYGLTGSARLTNERVSGAPVVAAVFKVENRNTGRVVFEMNYIRLEACALGVGVLVTTDMSGNPTDRIDVVLVSGGNIASSIAMLLCATAENTGQQPKPASRGTPL
jgi:hypothetical protein